MNHTLSLKAYSIAAIVLAAGRGTRMGQGPASKLLLPMPDGKAVLLHSVLGALLMEPLETIVIVQPNSAAITSTLRGLPVRFTPNAHYDKGMGTSLAAGVSALSEEAEGVVVLLGDEPLVNRDIVGELLRLYLREGKAVTIPRYGEQFGPPTLFSKQAFGLLKALEGDVGGKQIVARDHEAASILQVSEEDRPHDVDTPEDYRRLLEAW